MHRMIGISVALILLASQLSAAPYPDEAKAILEKAIKAQGGEAKLAKLKTARIKVKGKGDFPMVGEQDFVIEDIWQAPDRYLSTIEMHIGGQDVTIKQCLNGKEGWTSVNDMVIDMPKKDFAEFKEQAYAESLERLGFLKDDSFKVDVLKEIKVNDKPAVGVVVMSKGHRDVKLYFDKDSGLLVKREHDVMNEGDKDEEGKLVNQQVFFSDYKEKDGLKVAHKLVANRGGKKFIEAEVTDIELPDKKWEDSVFAKPEK